MVNIGLIISRVYYRKKRPGFSPRYEKCFRRMADMARDLGVGFLISTFRDFERGSLKRALIYNGDEWRAVRERKIDVIWENRGERERYDYIQNKKLSISRHMPMVNDPRFSRISDNKFLTYKMFPGLMPRSFLISSRRGLEKALPEIRTRRMVFKPLMESGGRGIRILERPPKKINKTTLVQEFVECRKIPEWGATRAWDMRITIISGVIDNAYIRIARRGSSLSNVHKGGRMRFLNNSDIPESVKNTVKKIDSRFIGFRYRMYTADFMLDKNNRAWLIEINSRPGIYYPDTRRQKEFYTHILKMLIKAAKEKK